MESVPLNMRGSCVSSDEELFENIRLCLLRGLPEIRKSVDAHNQPIVIVGSGPSLATQLKPLRELYEMKVPIIAVRDAHDWLIAHGIVPTFALSVDPLPTAAECFRTPDMRVHYLIASQSHPAMFDYLKGARLTVWHAYMKNEQREPKGRMLIGGSTTSGLRAIFVAWVLGYRDFHLFGLDSSMAGKKLRVTGDGKKPADPLIEVQIEKGGKTYFCNPNMALQAQSFQDCYALLKDSTFRGYGEGLIQAIIRKREAEKAEWDALQSQPDNGRISFIHSGGPTFASYRYRALMPSLELGASINDIAASTLIFSKPIPEDLRVIGRAKALGQKIIVDFCDDHFDWMHYQEALRLADVVTCSTLALAKRIEEVPLYGRAARIIPESYEFPLVAPHCRGLQLLWFGHAVNKGSLERVLPSIANYPLRVVGNFDGAMPWSRETMLAEFAFADIVIFPATDDYKSANRAVEAIRQGCFVIAEPHPALMDIPGIYRGDIKEGLEWAKRQSILGLNQRISTAQKYVTDTYSPKILTEMWRSAIQSLITSEVDVQNGKTDGSTSMLETMQT